MTVTILLISAVMAAWALTLAMRCTKLGAMHARVACLTIHYVFGSVAIGAGIQLLFRG